MTKARTLPMFMDKDRTGRIAIRTSTRMMEALEERARLSGRSVSAEVRVALSHWLDKPTSR